MAFGEDLRWRAVVLYVFEGWSMGLISLLLGCSRKSVENWVALFNKNGNVVKATRANTRSRWPEGVFEFVRGYRDEHPAFFLDELQAALKGSFPEQSNFSIPTICRALRHDLQWTRKVIEKRAREARASSVREYRVKLEQFYRFPAQLMFVDETGKDNRGSMRRYAYSPVGQRAVVSMPFARGERVSALAAFGYQGGQVIRGSICCSLLLRHLTYKLTLHSGFIAWHLGEGTYTRAKFHEAFVTHILPHVNPYPLHHSIVVMDNAKIHHYKELEQAINGKGGILLFLPPYSPQLNPIEVGFSNVKRWIQRHAFHLMERFPAMVLDAAFQLCTARESIGLNLYSHCGYGEDLAFGGGGR